jgi:uncharacterized protein YegL
MRPGGELATRPLHFIWLCDSSGSMATGGKIQSLNTAIRDSIPAMRQAADDNPNAEVLVRALRFGSGAQWHVPTPTRVADFQWPDLRADGVTDLGRALLMVTEQLKIPPMTDRALPPVLVLLSDGMPTDDYQTGLQAMLNEPWGKKAVRIAIAIGQDADLDVLQKFIANPELKPLQANNAENLVHHIRWASTAVLKAASQPASQTTDAPAMGNVPVPVPIENLPGADDVW